MLKRFLLISILSSAASVGCSTTESKPDTTLKPTPKSVVPPVTSKTMPMPAQKKPTSKPHLDVLRVPFQNNDAVLGKQWASCTADIAAMTTFIERVFKDMQPFMGQKGAILAPDAIHDLNNIAFVFQRYSVAALGEPPAKAVFEQQFATEMTQYMHDWQQLWTGVDTTKKASVAEIAVAQWTERYKRQVKQALARSETCVDSIKANEARFLPKVKQDVTQLLKKHKPSTTKF
jgi:hypothetical protein